MIFMVGHITWTLKKEGFQLIFKRTAMRIHKHTQMTYADAFCICMRIVTKRLSN